jgi:hypothetical protein
VSVKAMAWAWEQPVGGSEKLVLLRLADHANDDGLCWPSQDTMHVKCGVSERTVRESLGKLEGRGLISRTPRWREGRRTTDLIRLLVAEESSGSQPEVPAGSQPAESAAGKPADSAPDNRQDLPGNPKKEPSSSEPSQKKEQALSSRRDLIELSHRLADAIRADDSRAKVKPDSVTWLDPLRLLIDHDGRTVDEVRAVIDWCQEDDFERTHVLSPRTLRKRFTALRKKAVSAGAVQPENATPIPFRQGTKGPSPTSSRCAGSPQSGELRKLWKPIAEELREKIDEATFKIWLEPLHAHQGGREIVIHVKPGTSNWIERRFGALIADAARKPVRFIECDCQPEERAA